jgi:hypothetical protein
MLNWLRTMGKVSEGFWRFIAAVMLFAVCWSLWIFYQLNPPTVVTGAAFEAAARARATQSAQGLIQPAPRLAAAPEPALASGDAVKLRLSESLAAPPVEKN